MLMEVTRATMKFLYDLMSIYTIHGVYCKTFRITFRIRKSEKVCLIVRMTLKLRVTARDSFLFT